MQCFIDTVQASFGETCPSALAISVLCIRIIRVGVKAACAMRVLETLAQASDNEYAMIDSAIVRAHQHCAGAKGDSEKQAIGRSRGGLSTKIPTTVDALGNPTGFVLTPGQSHDLEGADALFTHTPAQTVIADKVYDSHARLAEPLLHKGKSIVISSRATNRQTRDRDWECTKPDTSSRTSVLASSSAGLSPCATTRRLVTSWAPSTWLQL